LGRGLYRNHRTFGNNWNKNTNGVQSLPICLKKKDSKQFFFENYYSNKANLDKTKEKKLKSKESEKESQIQFKVSTQNFDHLTQIENSEDITPFENFEIATQQSLEDPNHVENTEDITQIENFSEASQSSFVSNLVENKKKKLKAQNNKKLDKEEDEDYIEKQEREM